MGASDPTMIQSKLFTLISEKEIHTESRGPRFIAIEHNKKKVRAGVESARVSYESFKKALQLTANFPGASLVTLPVSKENIIRSGVAFAGHTEMIGEIVKRKVTMCMYHPELSVFLLTNHIPLKMVPEAVKKVDFISFSNAIRQFQLVFGSRGKGAMLGLNPHAGENGKIGNEESFLKRKMKRMPESFMLQGPMPADSFFSKTNIKTYDWVIACYHDQGLIPFKSLFGFYGLNITLNSPFLRVSPDHGPAFSLLSEKKSVDKTGVLASIQFALKWGKRWKMA